MQSIQSLTDIADLFDVFLIDIFGVLSSGKLFYPDALSICQKLLKAGKQIYILSNATTTSNILKEKYAHLGFFQNQHYSDLITSGDLLKEKLEKENYLEKITGLKKGKYFIIGQPNDSVLSSIKTQEVFDINEADAIYFGALMDLKENKKIFLNSIHSFEASLQKAIQNKLPAICANPDYFAFHGEMQKHLTQGSLGLWYEQHHGKVYWIGKPFPEIYKYTLNKYQINQKRILMIGDTIRTDILGAQNMGFSSVLILKTGVSQYLINHGETLNNLIKKEKAEPSYILKGLQ